MTRMAGKRQQSKHRLRGRPRHVIEMVDTRNLEAHFLTDRAAVAGRRGRGPVHRAVRRGGHPGQPHGYPETGCRSCRDAIAQRGSTG
ncbi:MAG: hypothetical protein ACRDS1_17750 [Pseudonocardiaceae bacterium]